MIQNNVSGVIVVIVIMLIVIFKNSGFNSEGDYQLVQYEVLCFMINIYEVLEFLG